MPSGSESPAAASAAGSSPFLSLPLLNPANMPEPGLVALATGAAPSAVPPTPMPMAPNRVELPPEPPPLEPWRQ